MSFAGLCCRFWAVLWTLALLWTDCLDQGIDASWERGWHVAPMTTITGSHNNWGEQDFH